MTAKPVEEVYAGTHAMALSMIARLLTMVEEMPAPGGDRDIDWANVGDLAHVCELLQQAIDFTEDVPR